MRTIFLLYVSRSGSTLLAQLLERHAVDLLALPEFQLPERMLLEGGTRALPTARVAQLVERDAQWENLGLPADRFTERLRERSEWRLPEILELVAGELSPEAPPRALLVQRGLVEHAFELQRLFSDVGFLHVVRDPRAVTSSLLRAIGPYSNQNLGRNDPVYCALAWRSYVHRVQLLARRTPRLVHQVFYEELCRRPEPTLRRVTSELGLDYSATPTSRRRLVGPAERELHPLATRPPSAERVDAWREELGPERIAVVETFAGRAMESYGYYREAKRRLPAHRVALALARHTARQLGSLVRRFLARPGDLTRALLRRVALLRFLRAALGQDQK